jgi:hypothetical protein
MERPPAAGCNRAMRGRDMELQRTLSRYLLAPWWGRAMSDGAVGLLFLVLLFLVEPISIGVCARKIYNHSGFFWGVLSFRMNIGALVFFEGHRASHLVGDTAAEVGTIMSLSAILTLAALEVLRKGPRGPAEDNSPINLRRGLFRIWITMFGPWTVFCALTFRDCARYRCPEYGPEDYIRILTYWDVATWFIGIPVLVFIAGLAACWAIDGSRRSPRENGGQSLSPEPKPAIGEADESLAAISE